MERFYRGVVKNRKLVFAFFVILTVACIFLKDMVGVNYDLNDYLPEDAKSTVSLNVMEEEFTGGIPNARVMIRDVTIPEALEYKEKMEAVEGVTDVTWLDDSVSIEVPLEMMDDDVVETYYKDGNALFTVTIEEHHRISAVSDIRKIIGDDNAMTGSAVSTAVATTNTVSEIQKITVIAVLFVLLVLIITTKSWLEPLVVLTGLGVAIAINNGTNLLFGEISFVTNAAGSILQLAVSLDYSVFLMHRFEECRKEADNVHEAMVTALCKSTSSIASSGLTTVIGFMALVLMQFRLGPDLGLALAKGVAISLITVFLFMPALILMTYKLIDKTAHKSLVPDFHGVGKLVRKISIPMIALFIILIVPSYLASNSNSYIYGSSKIYGEGTTYGRDKKAIEQTFGKSDTYVLMVPEGDSATERKLSDELHTLPQVTDIISYVDTVGAEIPEEYLDSDTLSLLRSGNYSRLVIAVDAEYEGEKTFELVEQIRNIADKYYPERSYLAGEGVSTYDLMDTITDDMVKVNLLAIGAVFLVLLVTLKSVVASAILVVSIETAIWLNLTIPYFMNAPIYYIAYLIISSVQLGATVDYAILMTDRYRENREVLKKKDAVVQVIADVAVSILTSGSVLAVVGLLLGNMSTNKLLAQLGIFIGRGAIFSLVIVLFVLPGMLMVFDKMVVPKKEESGGKKMKKCGKKIMASLLVAALVTTTVPSSVFAAGVNTEKEEVIYANLNADGSVKEINVVNILEPDKNGTIVDYGDYENLRNMTTTDEIHYEGDTVTISTDAEKLYYEGKLKGNTMPWNITIRYFMDGTEYPAEEIAGKSGDLKITVAVRENKDAAESFFENYALQASITLNTDTCTNIQSEEATIANVGNKKQLTYTILPGKEADITITAEVQDFETDGFSVNGIPLNLNVEVDDEELMSQVHDLIDAIEQIDDGTGEVKDGAEKLQSSVEEELQSGVDSLNDGAGQLYDGAGSLEVGGKSANNGAGSLANGTASLDSGLNSLNTGIAQVQSGLDALNQESGELTKGSAQMKKALEQLQRALGGVSDSAEDVKKLVSASSQIKTGIDELTEGTKKLQSEVSYEAYKALMKANGLDIDELVAGNNSAIQSVQSMLDKVETIEATLKALHVPTEMIEPMKEQCVGLANQLLMLLVGNNAAISGTEQYLNGVSAGIDELVAGAETLQANYAEFDAAIGELAGTLTKMMFQMTQLKDAVNTLVEEYGKLDDGVNAYTEGVVQVVAGYRQVSEGAGSLALGSKALKAGSASLYQGTGELLSGIHELYTATGTLRDGTGKLDEGVAELLAGVVALYDGTSELKDGTGELRSETDGMDDEISDQIDDLISSITGDESETISFVSDKNTNVDAVQFVIQTEGIHMEEVEETEEETEENPTFWQKFLELFH